MCAASAKIASRLTDFFFSVLFRCVGTSVPSQSIPSQKWESLSPRGGKLVSLQAGLCAAAATGPCGARRFCFSNTLGSHMVLQRDARAAIYGFTVPGDTVTCTLTPDGGIAKARAQRPSPRITITQTRCIFSRTVSPPRHCGCLHLLLSRSRRTTARARLRPPPARSGPSGPSTSTRSRRPSTRRTSSAAPGNSARVHETQSPVRPCAPTQQRSLESNGIAGMKAMLEDVLFGDVYFCGGQSNMALNLRVAFEGERFIEEADRREREHARAVEQENRTALTRRFGKSPEKVERESCR